MSLTIKKIAAGVYRTKIGDVSYLITSTPSGTAWLVSQVNGEKAPRIIGDPFKTKKAAVSMLESLARLPQDRTVSDTLQLFRRGLIEKDTQLTVAGIKRATQRNPEGKARCNFVKYTRKNDGTEWIDVITPQLKSRTVRPEQIRTVHRKRR